MAIKAYLSNISGVWPFPKQEEALRRAIPGWPNGVAIFRDELDVREKRGHRKNDLVERGNLLRIASRRTGVQEIVMASLAVWDWTAEGAIEALTQAFARGETVRVLDAGLTIKPDATAAALVDVAAAFAAGRKKERNIERGKPGGDASAAKRKAEAKAKADKIRDRWCLPTADYPTPDLLAEAGISLNTAKTYLGARPLAQKAHQASLKRKAARAAKESE